MKDAVGIVFVPSREISAAQDRLTYLLQQMYSEQPENREMIRLIMSTVGRGGEGDVGQRIRDEILVVQVGHLARVKPYFRRLRKCVWMWIRIVSGLAHSFAPKKVFSKLRILFQIKLPKH